jgi:hypothetical protein
MGTNIHAFAHRLTALSMACLASAGVIFCALSGLGCSFIQIQALDGRSIGNTNGDVYENDETAYLGVQCLSGSDAPFYDVDGSVDRLWSLSRIFLYIGLGLGATTTLFAWLLGSCVRPTALRWRVLSVLAACSAVFQIPIFLVFESDNCNFDITRQTCFLSTGAYLNVASVSIWIVTTIWVQSLRAPRWDEELDAWRVPGNIGHSSSSSSDLPTGDGREMIHGERSEETYDGVGCDKTAETMDAACSPPRTGDQSSVLPSPRIARAGNNKDIEKQLDRQRQNDNNNRSSFNIGKWGRNRSKESTSITNTMKQNLSNANVKKSNQSQDVGKNGALSFMKSMKNSIPRVQISKSSPVADLASNSEPMHHEPPITTQGYTETNDFSRHNNAVDKSIADDTGRHAVNQSQNTDITATSSTNNRVEPGFHVSCVYSDGTRKEAHFPSMPNCCIGMGDAEEEQETKFRTFPQVSDDFGMVGFDDFDNKNSDSTDFLVRKLRKEEEAAAARRAKRNMAPVATFEFVPSNRLVRGDRRKNGNDGHRDVVMNDDVSEMTRGSGWASGVSEILDDTDLRHQPNTILEDLTQEY